SPKAISPRNNERRLRLVRGARVGWGLSAFGHAVVAHNRGDPQPVVGEHAAAALGLAGAVLLLIAPTRHRLLAAPERQRQKLAGVAQALEALDRNKAVNLLELGAQRRCDRKIVFLAPGSWPDLEDHGNHDRLHTTAATILRRAASVAIRKFA